MLETVARGVTKFNVGRQGQELHGGQKKAGDANSKVGGNGVCMMSSTVYTG